jgi:hypothetical protein
VETQNGKWSLSCIGEAEIIEGPPLDRGLQFKSTADDPLGFCFTPFGQTEKFHTTITPSGQSTFVCQGDLTP